VIRLVQWLCPQRHCIVAVAYDPEHQDHDAAIAQMESFVAAANVLPHCGLCGSKSLFYDDQPTKFETMQQAQATRQSQNAGIFEGVEELRDALPGSNR